jgi:hypothetical protein
MPVAGTLKSHTGDQICNLTMNLFGMPHQFTEAVDPRIKKDENGEGVSDIIGTKFMENIVLEAPVATIIPGKPKYLPNQTVKDKMSTTAALFDAASGDFNALNLLRKENGSNALDELRLYDFEPDYATYIEYVNILCRAGAAFLELEETVKVGSTEYSFQKFNWDNYKWSKEAIKNGNYATYGKKTCIKNMKSGKTGSKRSTMFDISTDSNIIKETIDDMATSFHYVQFFCDPDNTSNDSVTNSSTQSMMKGLFENGQSTMKDLAFMANSGGMDTEGLQKFSEESFSALSEGVQSIIGNNGTIVGTAGGALSRIINLTGDVIKGNNIIIPNIYDSSSYGRSMSLTCHLRSPYGTKLAYYLNIFVPLMHLLALALPRQASANSYGSPFLIKGYVEGMWTCNLGLVSSIAINKNPDSLSADGLPMEVDVTIEIEDLYSDLSMTPSTSPLRFMHNTSLVEFLATNCGMSLTKPNYQTKFNLILSSIINKFTDIPDDVNITIKTYIENLLKKFTSLT